MNAVRVLLLVIVFAPYALAQTFRPDIPRAWDDKEVGSFELPLAQKDRSPRYMNAEQYYALKVRPIYRSYPAYAKGREPAGYLESLKQKEPEVVFDAANLHTKEDWIQAGKLVFESAIAFRPAPESQPPASDIQWLVSSDGVIPNFIPASRYYVRKKGVLEVGGNSCASCHTRVMPDGSFVAGAQGSEPSPLPEATARAIFERNPSAFRDSEWIKFGAPWVIGKEAFEASLTEDESIRRLTALHAGVLDRQGTSSSHPPHIPSLIGIDDIKYLDATGLVRHRSIGDLMRYAIANQGLDTLAHYGDFQPGATTYSGEEGTRYIVTNNFTPLRSTFPRLNPRPIRTRRIIAHAAVGKSFRSRVARGATRHPFTPATNSHRHRASRFHLIFLRAKTS